MASSDNELIVVLGPTAVGKTETALSMAERWGCPIINCDSRQIYKDMKIGTAAPTEEEMARVKHYMVGILALDEYYSAARYEEDVLRLLEQLFRDHRRVILSGGSMMERISTFTDLKVGDFVVHEDHGVGIYQGITRLQSEGLDPLLSELKLLDPEHYARVDRKNTRRVVHALEICYTSGRPYSDFLKAHRKERPFRISKLGLRREREDLFGRINRRVDLMMEQGLMDEARRLYPYRHLNSLNTVGYKELFRVIDGEWPLDMAVERIKKNTRVYAKKQMTWFNKDTEIVWQDLT